MMGGKWWDDDVLAPRFGWGTLALLAAAYCFLLVLLKTGLTPP